MRKELKIIAALLGFLVLLAITKPSEKSFTNYLKKECSKTDSKEGSVKSFFNAAVKSAYSLQANLTKEYKDKTFFATVKTYELDEEKNYLGILGFWISL